MLWANGSIDYLHGRSTVVDLIDAIARGSAAQQGVDDAKTCRDTDRDQLWELFCLPKTLLNQNHMNLTHGDNIRPGTAAQANGTIHIIGLGW